MNIRLPSGGVWMNGSTWHVRLEERDSYMCGTFIQESPMVPILIFYGGQNRCRLGKMRLRMENSIVSSRPFGGLSLSKNCSTSEQIRIIFKIWQQKKNINLF